MRARVWPWGWARKEALVSGGKPMGKARLAAGARLAAAALAAALALVAVVALSAFPTCAFAAEESNEINTRQLPDSSFIYDTSISELANADALTDRQTVQTKGEVVGDRVFAGLDRAHCWITLTTLEDDNDDTVAVYMSAASAESIDTFGAYGRQGTILQVRGTFHLSCAEHEGVSDIHAESVTVVQEGMQKQLDFNPNMLLAAGVVLVVGVLLLLAYRLLQERRK